MTDAELVDAAELDRTPRGDAAGLLRPACASTRWIERVLDGRPYGSLSALIAASDRAIAALSWPDIEEALAAHPRIGGRALSSAPEAQHGTQGTQHGTQGTRPSAPGTHGASAGGSDPGTRSSDRETSWSQQEQAAAAHAGADVQAALGAGNAEYEERFGHVFLICATGRSATEILSALHSRLGHDPAAEREVVRAELIQIVRLRLAKAFR
jgi:2-oxo-4-hydroxy-4-carboxy-5-ureidoimidazoline decarboxylase